MKSQLDVSNVSLLTSVYSQSWPAPDPNNTPRKGFTGSHRPKSSQSQRCFNNQVTTKHKKQLSPRWNDVGKGVNNLYGTSPLSVSGMGARDKNAGRNEGIIRSTDLPLHLGLDKGTLQWKSWSSFKHDLEKHDSDDDLSLYKLTQDTFRKLTQQVNKASHDLSGRYNSTGFRGVRRSQLAASLPASQPSIQVHKEGDGEMEQFQSSLAIQCTPFKETKPKRPKSHLVTSHRQRLSPPQRPHSSLGTVSHSDVNRFDQLSPRIIRHLKNEAESDDGGDGDTDLGPYDIINDDFKLDESDLEDSDELQTFETDEIDDDGPERRSLVAASMEMDSSEDEEQIQQRIQRVRKQRDKMRKRLMKMDLPPEVMSGDLECMFSYRASSAGKKKKQDPFPEALSEPYCHMDLLELSMLDKDWRTLIRTAPDEDDAAVMERMIEMEKLQFETAEWESQQNLPKRRVSSALQTKKGWNADAAVPTERAHSALAKPKQSKNCCEDCLQVVCAGDCPSKNAPANGKCVRCRQPYCNGSCTEFGYHMHIRQAKVEEKVRRRPKSCHTCRRKTTQSIVNTNNVIMGRPRSGFATYSSGRVQSAKSRKMTVASSAGAEHVSERMEKLGLSARKYKEKSEDEDGRGDDGKKRRPRTAGSGRHVRGRDALISGKSYQSQRRFSLTEELVSTTAASMNPKGLRVRSAHYRTRKARQKHRKGKRK